MQLDTFKGKYQALQNSLKQEFLQDTNATERLVIKRSEGIDELLTEAWREFSMPKTLCLIAVGGYGRGGQTNSSLLYTKLTSERGQHAPKHAHYSEVPLYSDSHG